MKFVDLNKLKIIQSHNFDTRQMEVELESSDTVITMRNKIRPYIKELLNKTALETLYRIDLVSDPVQDDEDADAFFQVAVNVISAIFYQEFCLPQTRKRERRLDVPENFKILYANMSAIKKTVNQETYNDIYNLEIHWTNNNIDFHYYLLPEHDKNKGREIENDH